MVAAYDDGTARVWSAQTGAVRARLSWHRNVVTRGEFSPDGSLVATSSEHGTATLWSASTGELLATLKGHRFGVTSVRFRGRAILTASRDGTAKLWSADDGRLLSTFQGHTRGLPDAVFSPDARMVITSGDDNTARRWSVSGGRLLARPFVAIASGDVFSIQPGRTNARNSSRDVYLATQIRSRIRRDLSSKNVNAPGCRDEGRMPRSYADCRAPTS